MNDALIVLDIGKTNVKLALVDAAGTLLAEERRANAILQDGPYPHHDIDGIWTWMLATCRTFSTMADVSAIVPVTHGATAALVDAEGLVLPVIDYEAALPGVDYDAVRPPYRETYSPDLPVGLNLGRQLVWLAQRYPDAFARAQHILMYPQYWAWRLCGVAASEATSLGCHTDLWNPVNQTFSRLVSNMQWEQLMPALASPATALGTLLPEIAAVTGLAANCQVLCGIHDSNASLVRYLDRNSGSDAAPRTVLSTGTWVIAAAFGVQMRRLREERDMLANTNALGQPVACMRFMGGREFAALAGPRPEACTIDHIAAVIARGTMALPSFAEAGPFAGRVGTIAGPAPQDAPARFALATLYCVLMTDYCLDALGARGPLAVEGSFTANPLFGALLAALRPQQAVSYSDDASGTTCGGWMLRYPDSAPRGASHIVAPQAVAGLDAYRGLWLAQLDEHQAVSA